MPELGPLGSVRGAAENSRPYRERSKVTYVGDKIKFQNGFGAWQFATYACDYDPIADDVLNVDASLGRLPE